MVRGFTDVTFQKNVRVLALKLIVVHVRLVAIGLSGKYREGARGRAKGVTINLR